MMHFIKNQESEAVAVFTAVAVRAVVGRDSNFLDLVIPTAHNAYFEAESVGE